MLQVYAEAKLALENHERIYLTKSEEQAMQRDNETFREQDISEQMFLNYFTPLTTRTATDGDKWMTAYEIYEQLEKLTKKDLGKKRANKFGGILRRYCAPGGVKRGKTSTLYHVKLKPQATTDSKQEKKIIAHYEIQRTNYSKIFHVLH